MRYIANIEETEKITRPYTLPPSRGRVGRSGKQKSYVTDRPTDRPTDTAASRVACPRLKIRNKLEKKVNPTCRNGKRERQRRLGIQNVHVCVGAADGVCNFFYIYTGNILPTGTKENDISLNLKMISWVFFSVPKKVFTPILSSTSKLHWVQIV